MRSPVPDSARERCAALDAADPLAGLRERFVLPPGTIYLDGNSLGPPARDTADRLHEAVAHQWGGDLVRSWNSAGWIDLPARLGAKIAPLIGAQPDEVIVTDSTSVNLFKLLAGAVRRQPGRTLILSERGNFPTDLYIAQGLIDQLAEARRQPAAGAVDGPHDKQLRLELVDRGDLPAALAAARAREQAGQGDLAVALLTQIDYRTGARLDMARITADVHAAGGLVLWDLAHSAGAFPVSLGEAGADLAVGCGYKYLNGGPGAPAFAFVARALQADFAQPLSGWMGHATPFSFDTDYRPAEGIARLLCGTPPILSMIALEAGLDALHAAQPLGGLAALREKSLRLTRIFAQRALERAARHGLRCVTPMTDAERGSQVSFTLPDADMAHAVIQALIARGVIGDFRAPDILRFGFAPLYLRHVDAWDAAEQLADVLDARAWDAPHFLGRAAVT
jgi:kynureninase